MSYIDAPRNGSAMSEGPYVAEYPGVCGGYPVIRETRILYGWWSSLAATVRLSASLPRCGRRSRSRRSRVRLASALAIHAALTRTLSATLKQRCRRVALRDPRFDSPCSRRAEHIDPRRAMALARPECPATGTHLQAAPSRTTLEVTGAAHRAAKRRMSGGSNPFSCFRPPSQPHSHDRTWPALVTF